MVLIEPFSVAGKLFPPPATSLPYRGDEPAPRKSKLSHLNAAPRQRGLFVLVEPRGGGYIYPANLSFPLSLPLLSTFISSFVLLFIPWAAVSSEVFLFSFFIFFLNWWDSWLKMMMMMEICYDSATLYRRGIYLMRKKIEGSF